MLFAIILFIFGFVLLTKGADFMVEGASSVAKKLKVSSLVIGLTIVAMGTSAPELIVNIMSAIQGKTDLALGNIVGSNSVNILFILGIMAIIYPITARASTVYKEIPFGILSILILAIAANDIFLNGGSENIISRSEGLMFLGFFVIYLVYTFFVAKSDRAEAKDLEEMTDEIVLLSNSKATFYIIGGIIALAIGSSWVVDGASVIAKSLGVSETVIGLTIVAIGTSLPEFMTGIVAARKKEIDIALGNIIGSTIFNTMGILGITAIIAPVVVPSSVQVDIAINMVAVVLLFVVMFTGKKYVLERWEGILMLGIYLVYMTYTVSSYVL